MGSLVELEQWWSACVGGGGGAWKLYHQQSYVCKKLPDGGLFGMELGM